MRARKQVALVGGLGIFEAALLVFLYAPIISYGGDASVIGLGSESTSGGGHISWSFTAGVSPSYAIFHCGEVYNPAVRPITNDPQFAFLVPYQLYSGGTWYCK